MTIQLHRTYRMISQTIKLLGAFVFMNAMVACSTSLEQGEELRSGDEMLEGPGVFSGEDGTFNIITLRKDGTYQRKQESSEEKNLSSDIAKQDLEAASKVLDEKLLELDKQKEELETLKREVRKKIEAND